MQGHLQCKGPTRGPLTPPGMNRGALALQVRTGRFRAPAASSPCTGPPRLCEAKKRTGGFLFIPGALALQVPACPRAGQLRYPRPRLGLRLAGAHLFLFLFLKIKLGWAPASRKPTPLFFFKKTTTLALHRSEFF